MSSRYMSGAGALAVAVAIGAAGCNAGPTTSADEEALIQGCTRTQGYWKTHPEAWPRLRRRPAGHRQPGRPVGP